MEATRKMELNYRPLPRFLTIKESEIEGLGLFATEEIKSLYCLGTSHILVGRDPYFELIRTPLGGFINHSDDPNCARVQEAGKNIWKLFTLRDINPNEELTLKYTLYSIK